MCILTNRYIHIDKWVGYHCDVSVNIGIENQYKCIYIILYKWTIQILYFTKFIALTHQ